ncbi:TrkA C-terminal domain-containing protein [Nocardia sp. AG03]|uniref:cation:proton antiporter regulatory subunit n=1 Tax=Nocardia sp. AG03 TaxID=3025312 RepID=UPI0024189FEA|nr:TrkA C-terminal domain-containing protein [Nocardia sp. AG03]
MQIDVTPLPGVGVRKDFVARKGGRRIGVVERRDGTIELLVGRPGNPEVTDQVALSADEASALASLLGAPRVVAQLEAEHRDFDGVRTRQFPITAGSPYAGRTLGETRMRTRTKASIVAAMRTGAVLASPGPEFAISAGDVLIVVGSADGLEAAARILRDG